MHTIIIPKVSLSDASGRDIGVYSDDPSWWENLKKKNLEANIQETPVYDFEYNRDSKKEPNKNEEASKKFDEESAIINTENNYALEEECNEIGETPLHIAIMHEDLPTLKLLIEKKGFDVNQRNLNGKFLSGFQQSLFTQSNYENLAYYGEYPLAFAACFANREIYDYLIEKGADPNLHG